MRCCSTQLISPSIDMVAAFIAAARDYRAHGERCYQRELEERGLDIDCNFDFGEYIKAVERDAGSDTLPNTAPQSSFWLVDDGRTVILGTSRLRHYLTAGSETAGGHIGYDVPPSQRNKGYGTTILKLTLEKARQIGLERVLVTCDADNVGSQKIIVRNGGVLENGVYSDEDRKVVKRYWIEL
ncbi:MAG: GNAT family N-acetyltransferase [Bacillota bacterium]